MNRILSSILLFVFGSFGLHAVPAVLNYAGQVAVNGQPFDGQGLFKFALVNTDGNITYWSNDGTSLNGSEPAAHVSIPVNGGLYSLLLGNTAMAGMGAIDPQIFAQHTDAKLRVWFSDGVNGFQQLSPDRPFASVPYAFSAGTAQSATIPDGSINKSMLGSDVIADLNATIGMDRLSEEVITKLDQNVSGGSGVVAGSIISVPSGQSAPDGYSLHQRGTPKELVWEEKASVSVARYIYDGAAVLDGKIYVAGGYNTNNKHFNIAERFDSSSNTWEILPSMVTKRADASAVALNGKLYVMGGKDSSGVLDSVEYYDLSSNSWTAGAMLPYAIRYTAAIEVNGNIFLIGGADVSDLTKSDTFCFNESTNQWIAKQQMPTPRRGSKLVWYENQIWVVGGSDSGNALDNVESYDPVSDTWQSQTSLLFPRSIPLVWVANGKIYAAGGFGESAANKSIEVFDPLTRQWTLAGNLPETKLVADSVVLNDQVYVIAGATASTVYSDKVFAADLSASVEGVYDLYRKDGNASAGTPFVQAEVADGSVTGSKMADGAVTASKIASKTIGKDQISDDILKYLKPEITAQPQAQTVYADSNVSFSVTAEGKYLNYQWKKDGSNLTGETNATLTIIDANATQHDGNYSVVVSNDFGSVESTIFEQEIISWHPKLINDLILWADASDLSTLVKSNSKVSRWEDKSGLANHFIQTVENNMPLFGVDKINDLNALSGDNTYMITNNNPFGVTVSNAFVTMVVKIKNIADCGFINLRGGGDNFNERWVVHLVQSWNELLFDVSGVNSPYRLRANIDWNVSDQIIFSFYSTVTGSVQQIWKNGSLLIGDSNTDASLTDGGIRIGNLNGYVLGEVFIVNGEVNSDTRIASEGYLAHKWGLTANLPSDHPYKNIAP